MIKRKSYKASVAAGASDGAIATITVPDNQKWTVLEVGATVASTQILKVYIEDEQFIEIDGAVNADVRRTVLNWELVGGTVIRLTGANSAGAAATFGGTLVYDVQKP